MHQRHLHRSQDSQAYKLHGLWMSEPLPKICTGTGMGASISQSHPASWEVESVSAASIPHAAGQKLGPCFDFRKHKPFAPSNDEFCRLHLRSGTVLGLGQLNDLSHLSPPLHFSIYLLPGWL